MKKINQKKFIKLSRRFFTEKEIKRVINFMRDHNGFISYIEFIFCLVLNAFDLDYTLSGFTYAIQLGCTKIDTRISRICNNNVHKRKSH